MLMASLIYDYDCGYEYNNDKITELGRSESIQSFVKSSQNEVEVSKCKWIHLQCVKYTLKCET